MKDPLFHGIDSLRVRGERMKFWLSLLFLPLVLIAVGYFLSNVTDPGHVALLIIAGMLYVSIARGRVLGNALRVTNEGEAAHLLAAVRRCARVLDVPEPHVFVRDDQTVPIVGLGLGEPYALVVSGHWLPLLERAELEFLVAREIAHIRCGNTRISSILSVNGRENALVSLGFGRFLRSTEYTADRVGLLVCGSLEAAKRAIAVTTFHALGRAIDLDRFARQRAEIDAEALLRMGEWLTSTPYATHRIGALDAFSRTELALRWHPRFAAAFAREEAIAPYPTQPLEPGSRRAFAGGWRRIAAGVVDGLLVSLIVPHPTIANVDIPSASQILTAIARFVFQHPKTNVNLPAEVLTLWVYAIVLVALMGQTIGMLIFDIRVVRPDLGRVGFGRAVLRYLFCALSVLTIIPILVWGLRRIQPYDRLSGTRIIGNQALRTVPEALPSPV